MKPNLKDLDEILGTLNPELQCGEGKLADVCRWHVAFKKQLEDFREKLLNDIIMDDTHTVDKNFVLWMVNDILGESKENGENKENRDAAKQPEEYKATGDVRDRALNYHKLALSDF